MKKIIGQLFRWLNIALILALLASYTAPFISPNLFWPFSFVGMAYPLLLVMCFVMLFIWAIQRKRVFWLNLIAILAGFPQLSNTIAFNPFPKQVEHNFTALSYNILYMRHSEYRRNEMDKKIALATNYIDLVAKQKPDVVCFQEAYLPKALQTEVERQFSQKMEINNVYTAHNLIIFSKYPIVNKGAINKNENRASGIFVDVKIDTSIIRIYNVHLQSNQISVDAETVMENQPDLKDEATRKTIRSILSRVKNKGQVRSKEAEAIHEHIAGSPHKVIVCGDFNEPPYTYAYAAISKGLKDSFRKKSFGTQFTYNGAIPFLRIDYILTDPSFKVTYQDKVEKTFSDHHPIVAKMKI